MNRFKRLLRAAAFIAAIVSIGICARASQERDVRILIADDQQSISVVAWKGYRILASAGGAPIMQGRTLRATVTADGASGINACGRTFASGRCAFETPEDSHIYINGKRFRGGVDIVRKPNGALMAINRIPLEKYLCGVLHNEVSDRWPMEALKAQAIAARTFAVYQCEQNRDQPYDLRSDIYSQVYAGSGAERWRTSKAVELTRSRVLVYKGKIFPAYFHATCGGSTEDAYNLWKTDIAPLKGVSCDYCAQSPYYQWTKSIAVKEIAAKLNASGYKAGVVANISVKYRDRSGRVSQLEVKDTSGRVMQLSGKDFRQILGPNTLRSTKFNVAVRRGQAIITGRGWGHGVGLCQWGAYGMARANRSCEEIISFYYPGAEIVPLDSLEAAG